MIQIVKISGKQGSGKSTVAEALKLRAKKSNYDFVGIMKFATTLYALHDMLLNKMETLTGVPRVKKDGTLLQLLGTEWGRKTFGENVWVDILGKEISKLYDKESKLKRLIIIDDCRFENEFDGIQGLNVRLIAPENIRKSRADAWRDATDHPSETGLDKYQDQLKFDLTLETSGDHYTPDQCAEVILDKLKDLYPEGLAI